MLTDLVSSRYTRETQIYTYIGEILVAINPYKDIGVHNPSEMNKYEADAISCFFIYLFFSDEHLQCL